MSEHKPEMDSKEETVRLNLSRIYHEVKKLDDEVLESLCPSFVQLRDTRQRYINRTPIGEGALKQVYRTFDQHTQRSVALAELKNTRGIEFFDQFVKEAWLISSLNHPNIIKIHDAGLTKSQRPYFTMDLKGEQSLADRILNSTTSDLPDLLDAFNKICDAIAYAHAKGILHLDLKPENIQCSTFGEVLVCDWGLGARTGAKIDSELSYERTNQANSDATFTLTGAVKGSPGYMAPEQVNPDGVKSQQTDIYALGCILHCILCGAPPFTGDSDSVLKQTISAQIERPSQLFPQRKIPPSLEAVILKATQHKPEQRYPSVQALKNEILKYQRGFSTQAEAPSFFREARLFLSRNRLPSSITAFALILITTLSVLFVQNLNREQLATAEERARADSLLAEVDLLHSDKLRLFEELSLSRDELATQLARAANWIRRSSFYANPIKSVSHAERLLRNGFELSKNNPECRRQRFQLQIIRLNFKAAQNVKLVEPSPLEQLLQSFAKEHSKYDFTSKRRPSWEQMETLFQDLAQADPSAKAASLIEDIISYQCASSPNSPPTKRAFESYLSYMHRGRGHFNYTPDKAQLQMKTENFIVLKLNRDNKSPQALLRHIPLLQLNIETTAALQLSDLDGLLLETLDLSKCQQAPAVQETYLPNLQQVITRTNFIDHTSLLNAIDSISRPSIIEIN